MKDAFLSIDFDFFSRELIEWDWGHYEAKDNSGVFETLAWPARYLSSPFNVYEETDPKVHADFLPVNIIEELTKKGLRFDRLKKIGFAESHREAYRFFNRAKAPPYLINIDAHHDIYSGADVPLDCGNWVSHLFKKWQTDTSYIQVYPKWRDVEEDDIPAAIARSGVPIESTTWEAWTPEPVQVTSIFVCRSGVWVPPHQDGHFIDMVKAMGEFGKHFTELGKLAIRRAPSYAEHTKNVATCKAMWRDMITANK